MKIDGIIWESEKNIQLRYTLGLNGAILHNGKAAIVDSVIRALSGTGERVFDISYTYLRSDVAGIRVTIKHWTRVL